MEWEAPPDLLSVLSDASSTARTRYRPALLHNNTDTRGHHGTINQRLKSIVPSSLITHERQFGPPGGTGDGGKGGNCSEFSDISINRKRKNIVQIVQTPIGGKNIINYKLLNYRWPNACMQREFPWVCCKAR